MNPKLIAGFGWAVRGLLVFGGFAPFLPVWTRGVPGLGELGSVLDAWFSFQCHRDETRSLAVSAVCARCLGIYLGLALGALVARPRLAPKNHALWLVLATGVLVADVLTETLALRPPSTALRIVTGLLLAYPAAVSIARVFFGARSDRDHSAAQIE